MTIFVTKWVLTRGMQTRELGHDALDGTAVVYPDLHKPNIVEYYHKGEWHRTLEDAIIHAQVMQKRRIASLEKSLVRVRALTFGG